MACHSDHRPLLLNTNPQALSLPKPFRFEQMWVRDPYCGDIISNAWHSVTEGRPMIRLVHKMKVTKLSLKRWNKLSFDHVQSFVGNL